MDLPAKKQTSHRLRVASVQSNNGAALLLGDFENMYALAVMLKHLPLSLGEHYLFATAPSDASDATAASALLSFATAYSLRCGGRPLEGWASPWAPSAVE